MMLSLSLLLLLVVVLVGDSAYMSAAAATAARRREAVRPAPLTSSIATSLSFTGLLMHSPSACAAWREGR